MTHQSRPVTSLSSKLTHEEDIFAKEIESWKGFGDALRGEDRELFNKMLADCKKYSEAVNAKGEPFPTESLLMAMVFSQHMLIGRLLEMAKPKMQASTSNDGGLVWLENTAS